MKKSFGIIAKIFIGIGVTIGVLIVAAVIWIGSALHRHDTELKNLQKESTDLIVMLNNSAPQVTSGDCRDVELRNECYIKTPTPIDFNAASKPGQKLQPGIDKDTYTYPSSIYSDKLLRISYTSYDLNTYYIDK